MKQHEEAPKSEASSSPTCYAALEGRIARLRKALHAATDIGIYPVKVVGGDAPYEQRTEFMEGWNAAASESMREAAGHLEPGDWDEEA